MRERERNNARESKSGSNTWAGARVMAGVRETVRGDNVCVIEIIEQLAGIFNFISIHKIRR